MSAIFEAVPDDAPVAAPAPDPSLAELAQARRAAFAANSDVVIDVPGFGGKVKGRYRLLTYRETRAMVERVGAEGSAADRDLLLFADTLIAACDSVYKVNPDGTQTHVGRWTPELAVQFGYEATTARDAVFTVFERDTLVADHFYEYSAWADSTADTGREEEADFFG